MLKGISPLLSPELLSTLYRMGHGDEIVFADAHFPGESTNDTVIRADGLQIAELLDAVLPLLELDSYVSDPVLMMSVVPGDSCDPSVEASYKQSLEKHSELNPAIMFAERFEFYERAKKAFAVVMTGDTRKYGNILFKKGVTPV
ncbi:L-fucose mutarotase [Pseudoteredinibacter isoporae]|uniref:L-fucose mutarotase n=1 Tax=Pseudoteredinibacter isoporae TaxID=570281 RepID=A0A7X0JVF3_9GAMM|nr:L-fucose mutarotase [Pseudoteredinibacter isoporae]MBB6522524.1 L-fucose mutarotase [Pseudoteredinibacter isoporae]NHO88054.1 L-fucose mutarotase [Pseudoteredinibacter isoporae]NIB23615.1 L-fucose mutarotase [Pseudoteredinibacter isoporae]